MGVYIKGMEMPKSCIECPLHDGIGCNAFNTIKPKTLMSDKRIAFCPLVEVPEPHGDLMGTDWLLRIIDELRRSAQKGKGLTDSGIVYLCVKPKERKTKEIVIRGEEGE